MPARAARDQVNKSAAVLRATEPRGGLGSRLWPALLLSYVVLALFGYWWLRQPGVMVEGQDLSYDRAMFLSVNAITLTGFQQTVGPNEFNPDSAQGPMLVLVFTIVGSLLAMIIGGCAAARALRLPYSDRQIVTAALIVEVLAMLAGAACLLGDGRKMGDAIQLAASAFGNSGTVVMRPGVVGMPPLGSWRVHCVLLPLSVLGGLGLPVLMELYDAAFGIRPLSRHSRIVLSLTAGIYLFSVIALVFCMMQQSDAPSGYRDAIVKSSAASLDARTAGLPLDLIKNMPVAQWIIMLLMVIGASSAGTGGGLKTTTFFSLFTGVRDVLSRRIAKRVFGIAATWVAVYLAIVFAGFLILSITEPQVPADRLLFLTISAASNVGLSHDPISIVGPGLYWLDLLMLLGRMSPLAVLWWVALGTDDTDVLVG